MKGKNERECMFELDQRAYDYFFWAMVLMDYKTKQSRGPGKILEGLSFSGYQYLDSASSNKWK